MRAILVAFLATLAVAASAGDKIRVELNGKSLDLKTAPILRDGEVWVPVKEITVALGGHLQIIKPNKLLGVCLGDKCTPLKVGRDAVMVKGTAMASAKKMVDALEAKMKWDKRKKLLRLSVDRPLPSEKH